MKYSTWVKTYKGKRINYDGVSGVQCVDLAKHYCDKVLGLGSIGSHGNAKEWWNNRNTDTWIKNNFTAITCTYANGECKVGDIGIRATGVYGHIFIIASTSSKGKFTYYDENGDGNGAGMTLRSKAYSSNYITGILRPKNSTNIDDKSTEIINKAVNWAIDIANDSSHGYDQVNRWGPDYDCSSLVISAYKNAGLKVYSKGATNTRNMYKPFLQCGFEDVTKEITLSSGKGLKKGDVLLTPSSHTAMMTNSSKLVQARMNENNGITGGRTGDQTGDEIHVRSYYNFPWTYVLRYPGGSDDDDDDDDTLEDKWASLYDTENTREDAIVREVGYIDNKNKPSINTSNIKLSVINYTSTLSDVFDIVVDTYKQIDTKSYNLDTLGSKPRECFEFFIDNGLLASAAIGILANIRYDSNFDASKSDTKSKTYGLCRWSGERSDNMKSTVGKQWKTNLTGQLIFLWYELEYTFNLSILSKLKTIKNNKLGCQEAAEIFCSNFGVATVNESNIAKRKEQAATYWDKINS
jgi:hypothetical protein